MTRKIWSAALALSLAGGVYMARPAVASNMGFKLERDFDLERNSSNQRLLLNVYFVSFPNFNGLGDIANSTLINPATTRVYDNRCVGESNGPPAGQPDGEINVDDFICDAWTARLGDTNSAGAFQVISIDAANCATFSRTGRIGLGGLPVFAGTEFPPAGTDLWTNRGYQVNIGEGRPTFPDPRNRAVIVGSHDPSFAGQLLHFSTTCGTNAPRADFITVPYHTMYQEPVEVLCGLRGLHWTDADNNWRPDDPSPAGCANGIFDGTRAISVISAKNDDPALGGESAFKAQTARLQGIPPNVTVALLPPDPPFHLIPGESYRIPMLVGQADKLFVSPHF